MVHIIYPKNYYASDERIKGMAADVLVDEMKASDYKTVAALWHETVKDISVEEAVFILEDGGLITTVKEK